MHPEAQPAPSKPKGGVGIAIGIVLLVAGMVVGIVGVVGGVRNIGRTVDGYQRVSLETGGAVRLDPGTYRVFLERRGIDGDQFAVLVPQLSITSNEGQAILLLPVGNVSETYSFGGRSGRKIGRLVIPSSGTYRITVVPEGGPGSYGTIAIGKRGPIASIAAILIGVFGGGAIALVGLVVLIVSGVRRGRSKNSTSGWAPPPPTPTAGPPGWAPPPPTPPAGPDRGAPF